MEVRPAGPANRSWVTNDNTAALAFHQRRGWDLVALPRAAVAVDRRLKPRIPATGRGGIPIRHVLELERRPTRREGGDS